MEHVFVCDIVDDGSQTAEWQMERDRELIANLSYLTAPLIRFYEWHTPSITYGCFIDPTEYLRREISGFELAKRPTGGGILFHLNDFAFTVAVPHSHPRFSPNVLDNYRWINETVVKAISKCDDCDAITLQPKSVEKASLRHFCMATPTQYDLLLNGKKVGGAAQRKTNFGFV
ncbi:MAG TPA: lipoate--protein ligase family protein, partial [Chlamydiales bacterium]|nr:lipoate--protein ligase family protein [Chlamydiales bacterium]